jgi:4-hydroxybenzoate polyprenyltransferase
VTDGARLFDSTARRAAVVLKLVRFSHTLFALPYVVAGFALGAASQKRAGDRPTNVAATFALAIAAAVCARTAAMAFNRLVDRRFDAKNPRTKSRPSVTGEASVALMVGLVAVASLGFVAASFALNPLCGKLSFVALVVVLGYSYAKRATALSHFVLGIALGLAPVGAYLAARGTFDATSLAAISTGVAVVFWTAGFDILYACQDVAFDREAGLRSTPARLGIGGALKVARVCHALVPPALLVAAPFGGLGAFYLSGVAVASALLVYEHRLVKEDDLSQVDRAFFKVNVWIAVVVMIATTADLWFRG